MWYLHLAKFVGLPVLGIEYTPFALLNVCVGTDAYELGPGFPSLLILSRPRSFLGIENDLLLLPIAVTYDDYFEKLTLAISNIICAWSCSFFTKIMTFLTSIHSSFVFVIFVTKIRAFFRFYFINRRLNWFNFLSTIDRSRPFFIFFASFISIFLSSAYCLYDWFGLIHAT